MSTGMARRMSRLEAATEEEMDFGSWFLLLLASVNGDQAAKAEYQRAREAYPASHERFNEEFWAPFKPGGSHYSAGGIWEEIQSGLGKGERHSQISGDGSLVHHARVGVQPARQIHREDDQTAGAPLTFGLDERKRLAHRGGEWARMSRAEQRVHDDVRA